MANRLPVVGDVITSPEFAFGFKNQTSLDGTNIVPCFESNSGKKEHIVSFPVSADERVAAVKAGKPDPGKYQEIDLASYDPSRGTAEFVVEYCKFEGGSTGHDSMPDGWHVIARRLHKNGKYDKNGELFDFYYQYEVGRSNSIKKINFIRKMTKTFI